MPKCDFTNARLLEEASMTAFPSRDDQRKILLFSEFHNLRRAKLLGHILRSTNSDPLRRVSFMPNSASRIDYGKKRIGKPQQTWLHHAKKFVWEETLGRLSYEETQVQDSFIYNASWQGQF